MVTVLTKIITDEANQGTQDYQWLFVGVQVSLARLHLWLLPWGYDVVNKSAKCLGLMPSCFWASCLLDQTHNWWGSSKVSTATHGWHGWFGCVIQNMSNISIAGLYLQLFDQNHIWWGFIKAIHWCTGLSEILWRYHTKVWHHYNYKIAPSGLLSWWYDTIKVSAKCSVSQSCNWASYVGSNL